MPELHAGSERRIAGLHKLSAVSGCEKASPWKLQAPTQFMQRRHRSLSRTPFRGSMQPAGQAAAQRPHFTHRLVKWSRKNESFAISPSTVPTGQSAVQKILFFQRASTAITRSGTNPPERKAPMIRPKLE